MCCKGFIKRFAPFALAIALGLFVASFFVTVAAPNFNFKRGKFNKHREYDRQRDAELRQLRQEKSRLEEELRQEKLKNQSEFSHDWERRDYPLIRENDNFQPRIERHDVLVQPRKTK